MVKKKKPTAKPESYYVWVIAHIVSEQVHLVEKELRGHLEYQEVEACIPTVKIIKKTHKGKNVFDEVPLLFNYGFFKIPKKYAVSATYLENMRNNISCIYCWVRDAAKKYHPIESENYPGDMDIVGNNIYYATATSKDVANLIKLSLEGSIHSSKDLDSINPGQLITLRGYPFEGIQAELVSINHTKRKVLVKIQLFEMDREVEVSFDNVFFTVYHNRSYDDSVSVHQSFEIAEKSGKTNKHE